jgi:hypothetical protein
MLPGRTCIALPITQFTRADVVLSRLNVVFVLTIPVKFIDSKSPSLRVTALLETFGVVVVVLVALVNVSILLLKCHPSDRIKPS